MIAHGNRVKKRGWMAAVAFVLVLIPIPNIQAVEPFLKREQPIPVSVDSDRFNGDALGSNWTFDDPNGNDTVSLNARPGWLQIQVNGSDEDIWSDGRGGAPILRRSIDATNADFSLETYVDLATSNGGCPVLNSVAASWFAGQVVRPMPRPSC